MLRIAALNLIQNVTIVPWAIRKRVLAPLGIRIKSRSYIASGARFSSGKMTVDQGSFINHNLLIEGAGDISVGAQVRIGPNVQLLTGTHTITRNPLARASYEVDYVPKTIGNGVWIGAGAIILPGADVADGCVLASGAVLTRSTLPDGLYAGVPARRLRSLDSE